MPERMSEYIYIYTRYTSRWYVTNYLRIVCHGGILFGIYPDIVSGILSDIYSDILFGVLSGILFGILSGMCSGPGTLRSILRSVPDPWLTTIETHGAEEGSRSRRKSRRKRRRRRRRRRRRGHVAPLLKSRDRPHRARGEKSNTSIPKLRFFSWVTHATHRFNSGLVLGAFNSSSIQRRNSD